MEVDGPEDRGMVGILNKGAAIRSQKHRISKYKASTTTIQYPLKTYCLLPKCILFLNLKAFLFNWIGFILFSFSLEEHFM